MTRPRRPQPLTSAQMEVLEFERTSWKYIAAKNTAVKERFGLNPTEYSVLKNKILDLPAAEIYDPPLVRRLRRIRDGLQVHRGAARTGFAL